MRSWPVLLVLACAKPHPLASDTLPSDGQLTDVQLQCRSKTSLDIGRLNAAYGPTCNKPTMPLALNLFDLGSFEGESSAIEYRYLSATVCLCGAGPCDDALRSRVIDDAAHFDEKWERAANKTVNDIMNKLATHSCLDGTIAVELYKTGSACGFLSAIDNAALRARMEESFLKVFADDPTKARKFAENCWAGRAETK
jgi:hypothetical protein